MPALPLFWLTVFFMPGISADRLFGETLPVRTHYFAFAALILIAVYVVSGLHIGMVAIFVFWLFRLAVRFLFPSILSKIGDQQIALWPALASAVLYAFLAGFGTPTIWRSVLTLAVFFGAAFWCRKADSLTVLTLTGISNFSLTLRCKGGIESGYTLIKPFRLLFELAP